MDFLLNTFSSATVIAIIVFMLRNWFITRLTESIKHEYNLDLAKIKAELNVTNQEKIEKLKSELNDRNSRELEFLKNRLQA